MRHIFGFLRNARRHCRNAREGVPDAPFSRNCARSGSTASYEPWKTIWSKFHGRTLHSGRDCTQFLVCNTKPTFISAIDNGSSLQWCLSYHIPFYLGLSRFLASRAEENPFPEANFRDRGNHLSFFNKLAKISCVLIKGEFSLFELDWGRKYSYYEKVNKFCTKRKQRPSKSNKDPEAREDLDAVDRGLCLLVGHPERGQVVRRQPLPRCRARRITTSREEGR